MFGSLSTQIQTAQQCAVPVPLQKYAYRTSVPYIFAKLEAYRTHVLHRTKWVNPALGIHFVYSNNFIKARRSFLLQT